MLQAGADHLFVAAEDLKHGPGCEEKKKREKKVAFTDDQL